MDAIGRGMSVGGLAIALATLIACGSSPSAAPPAPSTMPPPAPPPAPAGVTVSIQAGARNLGSGAFGSNPLTLPVGSTVTWKNDDTATHTSRADAGTWNSGSIAPGGQFSATLSAAGTYVYHCGIHGSMTGTIIVQ